MNILEAIELELPRKRPGFSKWDDPAEFSVYHVTDIVAKDWIVLWHGRLLVSYPEALDLVRLSKLPATPAPNNVLEFRRRS